MAHIIALTVLSSIFLHQLTLASPLPASSTTLCTEELNINTRHTSFSTLAGTPGGSSRATSLHLNTFNITSTSHRATSPSPTLKPHSTKSNRVASTSRKTRLHHISTEGHTITWSPPPLPSGSAPTSSHGEGHSPVPLLTIPVVSPHTLPTTITLSSSFSTASVLFTTRLPVPIPFPNTTTNLISASIPSFIPSPPALPSVSIGAMPHFQNEKVRMFKILLASIGSAMGALVVVLILLAIRWRRRRRLATLTDAVAIEKKPEVDGDRNKSPWTSHFSVSTVGDEPRRFSFHGGLSTFNESSWGSGLMQNGYPSFSGRNQTLESSSILPSGLSSSGSHYTMDEPLPVTRAAVIADPNISHDDFGGMTQSHPSSSPDASISSDFDFAASLSMAFGTFPHDFPNSPTFCSFISESVGASPSSSNVGGNGKTQRRSRSQILHSTPVQSFRGSIAEALSMISVPDRLSSTTMPMPVSASVPGNGQADAKSTRSSRVVRFAGGSPTSSKKGRKSLSESVFGRSSVHSESYASHDFAPNERDIAPLFNASQETIPICMPSAPPTSSHYLDHPIPHSPMFSPGAVRALNEHRSGESDLSNPTFLYTLDDNMALTSRSTAGTNTVANLMSDSFSRNHAAALRHSLLFDPSLSFLPPASPSSDGLGLEFARSVGSSVSMSSLGMIKSPSNRDIEHSPSFSFMNKSPSSAVASPQSSPSRYALPESLSNKSLVLAAAIEALEADVLPLSSSMAAASPSISPRSNKSGRSERSAGGGVIAPPILSITDYGDPTATRATNTSGLPASASTHSEFSFVIAQVLSNDNDTNALADERLDSLVDDSGLYPSPPRPSSRLGRHRLSVSILPTHEATRLLEHTLAEISAFTLGVDSDRFSMRGEGEGDEGEGEGEEDTSSFEGDVTGISSLHAHRNIPIIRLLPSASIELEHVHRDDDSDSDDYDDYYDNDYDYGIDDLRPRPSEVVIRALEREGRPINGDHLARNLDVKRTQKGHSPASPSPLRNSHCAANASTDEEEADKSTSLASAGSRLSLASLASVYSQTSLSEKRAKSRKQDKPQFS